MTLVVAFNYGARQEIARAAQRLAEEVAAGRLSSTDITAERLSELLDVPDLPDPDLIIRTSGEQRLSNFLLWQSAYSELVFVPTFWPDFDRAALEQAISEYAPPRATVRRVGGGRILIMDGGKSSIPLRETTCTPSARNLWLRVLSAAMLAPLAIGAACFGDWPFTIFWGLAAIAVWWEWIGLVEPSGRNVLLATGVCALILQGVLLETGHVSIALMIVAARCAAAIVTAGRQAPLGRGRVDLCLGAADGDRDHARATPSTALPRSCCCLRSYGAPISAAYFAGRAVGGPKLAPAISPKKTWSGAIGGTVAGVAAAIAVAALFSIRNPVHDRLVALVLSVVSQAGDLFESWLKRRFDAKDASGLIPGHGGVMDRLDGFIFAAVAAALIGVAARRARCAGARSAGLVAWSRRTVCRASICARRRRSARVSILGATGSIGTSTLDLLLRAARPLSGRSADRAAQRRGLAKTAIALGARFAAIADPAPIAGLKAALVGIGHRGRGRARPR